MTSLLILGVSPKPFYLEKFAFGEAGFQKNAYFWAQSRDFFEKKFTPKIWDGVNSLDDRIGIERHLRKCPIRKLKEPF